MKGALPILILLLAGSAPAEPAEPSPAPSPCVHQEAGCATPEPKEARQAFERGLTLAKAGRAADAFASFEQASRLAPKNLEYLTAREASRQQVVLERLKRGNSFLLAGRSVEAMAEFRGASEMDPANAYAQERLAEVVEKPEAELSRTLRVVGESEEIELAPAAGRKNFHFRGETRGLIQEVARAFGVKKEMILERFLSGMPGRFEAAKDDVRLCAAVVECDEKTGRASSIERLERRQ